MRLGVKTCIQQDDYRGAAELFALAGVESRFDAERVLDKSAGQAGQVLIMDTFNGLPDEKRTKFSTAVSELAADTTALSQTCSRIRTMGFPNYYPQYMVLHGIRAFTAKPGDPTLVATSDPAAAWDSLLRTYLNCHEAPAVPLSGSTQATLAKDDVRSSDPNRMKPGLYQVQTNAGALVPTERNAGPTYMRMCFTQAMIDASNPVPQSGQCDRYKEIRSGNRTRIDFSCSKDGTSATGRSDETVDGNSRHSVIDVSTSDKEGTHTIHLETKMIFLGSDCNAAYPAPPAPTSVRE